MLDFLVRVRARREAHARMPNAYELVSDRIASSNIEHTIAGLLGYSCLLSTNKQF